MPTIEEKYNWLLSQLEVTDIDYWEGDALLCQKTTNRYFQFPIKVTVEGFTDAYVEDVKNVDRAVERCMGYV